ncbi:3-keto-disaccharide hydrolase [Formosa sp. 3Alg 14/1]|uniref:3-keto-disaccharide hydrolase n=1 Tax=Formosa sp. 3Alg 14/1 TaxID=3382190 RepID=UPI0039BE6ECC
MKKTVFLFIVLMQLVFVGCTEKNKEPKAESAKIVEAPLTYLPFKTVSLTDMSAFKEPSSNWQIVGDVYVDRSQKTTITSTAGTGVLVSTPAPKSRGNLFTNFEHGDIELEIDVMMPVGSNSGIYLQGRYEVQLFDSWGVKDVAFSDMGGIYQRWDDTKEEKGYEGHAPKINAAKSPGLWQHLKILFHAPRFNEAGEKIKNATFKEVWLNGQLVHENVEVTGYTRGTKLHEEKPLGPLMIQGDHGPVALKNIKYKLYGEERVTLSNVEMVEYDSGTDILPSFDTITPLRTVKTDSISAQMATGKRASKILVYSGNLDIPTTGDYTFDMEFLSAAGVLIVNKDTIVDYQLDKPSRFATVSLQKGQVPFKLIYNKISRYYIGLGLYVEGPNMEKHSLTAKQSYMPRIRNPKNDIFVEVEDEVIAQRSYFMHNGVKRTHVISVGTLENVNYAYDLESGSLLKAWDGVLLDATPMWYVRGMDQLGVPNDFNISFNGGPEFAFLENEKSVWPDTIPAQVVQKQIGYKLDKSGMPSFTFKMNNTTIENKIVPVEGVRGLKRLIKMEGSEPIWFKIADGAQIKKLPDGSYIIKNENYFIDFPDENGTTPVIRNVNGRDELVVGLSAGNQSVTYNIIW